MTAGGLAAILMTLFVELTDSRRSRVEVEFDISALPKISEFLRAFAARVGWDSAMADRLDAVGEEALLTLVQDKSEEERRQRRLLLVAYEENGGLTSSSLPPPAMKTFRTGSRCLARGPQGI